ncbi:cation channel sperm-associated auxiliary subunit TMEM249-like [Osmerus mordax]|uniref:cation channel sperm-associated auxiliary subunit TMEM249-like n=1 Tax=Osmerus mordax TaxID=8014 RepID=UPI00350F8632
MPTGIFSTWDHQFIDNEQVVTDRIKENPRYPFKEEENLFVLEYLHGNIWKGSLLLIASIIGTATYLNIDLDDHNKYGGFLVFSLCLSLWLLSSGAFRRRLVIDHMNKEYRFYIHEHLRHRQGRRMFKLMLNGYKIEERELSGFSEKYELLECQGRRIANKLNLNYFDYADISKRHIVVHRPKVKLSETLPKV